MDTKDIPTIGPSDWQPITDKHDLAVLGKLAEEASELCSAISRCIIQGLDEAEPVTGKMNRTWLEQELADVMAMTTIAIQRFNLNAEEIMIRRRKKIDYKEPWFDALKRP